MMRRFAVCMALIILAAPGSVLVNPPCPAAEPGSGLPSGTVRLPSGLTAHYAHYSDRNALRDSRRSGDAVIALTEGGTLLRLDLATLNLTREWSGPVPVACLGTGENGTVLAGFEDGRVCRVDPATLALTELARLPGKPRWVGALSDDAGPRVKSRLVVVIEQTRPVERNGGRFQVPTWVVQDLGPSKTYSLDFKKPEGPDHGDELPMMGRARVNALATDPDHPDGVIAALDGRGVVFVRVEGE